MQILCDLSVDLHGLPVRLSGLEVLVITFNLQDFSLKRVLKKHTVNI